VNKPGSILKKTDETVKLDNQRWSQLLRVGVAVVTGVWLCVGGPLESHVSGGCGWWWAGSLCNNVFTVRVN